MNLKESFENINIKRIPTIKDGRVTSVKELWDKEIEPNLIPKDIAVAWFKLLKEYTICRFFLL